MNKKGSLIRIGQIDFTNVLPIYRHFPPEELKGKFEILTQVPTRLNQALALGAIDIAPISSFAYAENYENYLLYPNLSVSALGKVNSIFLFYKKPFSAILKGRIALPTTSATSVILLKIILEKFYGGKPEYLSAPPVLNDMMEGMDAALLIGDHAIKANWENRGYEVMDLGEQWTSLTGKWMSFAVWAVRKEIAENNSEWVDTIYHAFLQSKKEGLSHLETVITEAQTRVGGTWDYWQHYFTKLCYDFDKPQQEGLQLYFDYARELGYINKVVPIQLWASNKVIQVNE